MKNSIFIISFITISFLSCKTNKIIASTPLPADSSSISVKSDTPLKSSPYPWGAALNTNRLKNEEQYRNTVVKEMGSVTAANSMKMGALCPNGRGKYNWSTADFFVDFAQKNNLRIHGHTLVWYKQSDASMPVWLREFEGTKEEWKQVMKEHITAVMTRYKGKVASWDVVNEAILRDGTFRTPEQCVWTRNIGVPEYIDWAFQCAYEADPDALLFYNDFGNETTPEKREAINELVAGMKERGVPIHGIGMQMHTGTHIPLENIHDAIQMAASSGLLVHISELDIRVNRNAKSPVLTDELSAEQAFYYKTIASYMKEIPAKQCHGITLWGVHDPSSWLSNNPNYGGRDWPLLFDDDYNRKPAYYGAVEGFQ